MSQRISSPKRIISDIIYRAYRTAPKVVLRSPPPACVTEMIATLTAHGIGDALMLTDLPFAAHQINKQVHVWAGFKVFLDIMSFHPCYSVASLDQCVVNPFLVDVLRLRECYDLGNGHQLQQLRRAWRLPIALKPQPVLNRVVSALRPRVILHFEPSLRNVSWQRKHWHPRMRELYPESKVELEKFIKRRTDLEFIEVGSVSLEIKGAEFVSTGSVIELVKLVQTGTWFIGIMSGPLHIAVASGLNCIVVANYPVARKIVLPCLKWTGTPEEEWYYPQNIHLHQESDSPLVPKFSRESLQAAFSGDVYPFFLDDWLGMIED